MRRTMLIMTSFVMLFTISFSITANADDAILTTSMITGGSSPLQVTRTCKYCNNRVAEVYCVSSSEYAPDVPCSLTSHQPCTIEQRKVGYANAWCSYCQKSYGWDWESGGHIDSCIHDSNSGIIEYPNVCNYGPRA